MSLRIRSDLSLSFDLCIKHYICLDDNIVIVSKIWAHNLAKSRSISDENVQDNSRCKKISTGRRTSLKTWRRNKFLKGVDVWIWHNTRDILIFNDIVPGHVIDQQWTQLTCRLPANCSPTHTLYLYTNSITLCSVHCFRKFSFLVCRK